MLERLEDDGIQGFGVVVMDIRQIGQPADPPCPTARILISFSNLIVGIGGLLTGEVPNAAGGGLPLRCLLDHHVVALNASCVGK